MVNYKLTENFTPEIQVSLTSVTFMFKRIVGFFVIHSNAYRNTQAEQIKL
jgi:hypothetical protein